MDSCPGQKLCNYYNVGENWTSAGGPLRKTLLSNSQGMLAISELVLYQAALFTLANWYINNSRHLARKYARIFVCGHYLFREANSFPRA